jgi:hypothetical protein
MDQTASTQAEGEPCLQARPNRKRAATRRAQPVSQRPATMFRSRQRPDAYRLRRIPEAENNSIPIDPGPAQFNAFYPQCSGHEFASFPEQLNAGALRIES